VAFILGSTVLLACDDDEPRCYGSDRSYEIGERFDNGCRSCVCNDDQTITCQATEACDEGCEDADGNPQDVGAFWPAGDGCNICQCEAAGEVSCTDNDCGTGGA
jgi:hypothetical protein